MTKTAGHHSALQLNNMAQPPGGQRHDRTALVLYGSETGNSQDVAEELGRVVEKLHFVTRVKEMDLVEIVCPSPSPSPSSSSSSPDPCIIRDCLHTHIRGFYRNIP